MRIRDYRKQDARKIGQLLASTYREFSLSHADPEEQDRLLGPFRHAFSDNPQHREAIATLIRSQMVYIAEQDGEIAGVLRGREGVLASLFVGEGFHRQGIGRRLVERFEAECRKKDVRRIRVAATLYAIAFYSRMGYRKTTGIRPCKSFEGTDLTYQPMRKLLD